MKNFDHFEFKSPNPELDLDLYMFFHRLARADLKDTFDRFISLCIGQFNKRFGIGQHVLESEETEIINELNDSVSFYISNYEEFQILIDFVDDFELGLIYEIIYSSVLSLSNQEL
jgi:hypothetical protein